MASHCSQLGIKIRTWFGKIGNGWWYQRRPNSGKKESDSHQWNEYAIPLETVGGRERNSSLEKRYYKSHSTGFLGDNHLQIAARTAGSDCPERVEGGWNRTAGPRLLSLGRQSSAKTSAMAVSSCPSRIQTGDWFFPKPTGGVSEAEIPTIDPNTTDDGKPEWTWFPGDDEFREKTPENSRWDIGSFRGQAARWIDPGGYAINYLDHTGGMDQTAVSSPVWNQSNLCHSSNLHPTLGRDPARLQAAERMLKDIIFDNQKKLPDRSYGTSATRPIAIRGGARSSTRSKTWGTGSDLETRCLSDSVWKTNWPVDRQTSLYNSGQLLETLAESLNISEKKHQIST